MIKSNLIRFFILLYAFFLSSCEIQDDAYGCHDEKEVPGFKMGTIFIEPDIITEYDASAFSGILYEGRFETRMFDRRLDADVILLAYVFDVSFDDGLSCKVRVNPEFGSMNVAMDEAIYYATIIGQMPNCLRQDLRTVTIHRGDELFGGADGDILIHTDQANRYDRDGILEETLFHEATHVSLDPYHYNDAYRDAMCADKAFISEYAEQYPNREDLAESFLTYFALIYRPNRISWDVQDIIEDVNEFRLDYFHSQRFDMYPAN